MRFALKLAGSLFLLLYVLPIAASAVAYYFKARGADWRSADRSNVVLLPAADASTAALVRVFSARTVSWRGILATHSWVVIKARGSLAYERFDYTAWGS